MGESPQKVMRDLGMTGIKENSVTKELSRKFETVMRVVCDIGSENDSEVESDLKLLFNDLDSFLDRTSIFFHQKKMKELESEIKEYMQLINNLRENLARRNNNELPSGVGGGGGGGGFSGGSAGERQRQGLDDHY